MNSEWKTDRLPEVETETAPKVETLNGLPAVELPGVGRALAAC